MKPERHHEAAHRGNLKKCLGNINATGVPEGQIFSFFINSQ